MVAYLNVTGFVPSFSSDIQPIFSSIVNDGGFVCAGCHPPAAGQNLSVGNAYNNLVGVAPAAGGPCDNAGVPARVTPGDLTNSALWLKINGLGACGSNRMPQSDPTFFDKNPDLLERIRSWILAGALND